MGAKILIVEDDSSREVLAELLREDGFDVSTAGDGQAALDQLSHDRFDLLISDLRMPRMSGLELVRFLRVANSNIPILMVSAFDCERGKVLDAGASEFISKPLDYDQLLQAISSYVAA